jgi:transcriptional regulator with XRE-family HTH domain
VSFAEQLRLARQRAGLSQQGLAEQMDSMTGARISQYESGKSIPSDSVRSRFEAVLGPITDTPPQDVPDMTDTDTATANGSGPKDDPPQPRTGSAKKSAGPKKSAAPKSGQFTLAQQLEFPYQLAANFLGPRLPSTAQVIHQQAPMCAAAWDQFLYRYPALREKIESGMIASDIVALLMAHAPIFQMAVAETNAINRERVEQASYDGGIGSAA